MTRSSSDLPESHTKDMSGNNGVRPRVLFISPVEPKPDGNGVEKRGWSHLEALAQIADVHLVLAMFPMQDYKFIQFDRLATICARVDLVLLERKTVLGETSPMDEFMQKMSEFFACPFRLTSEGQDIVKEQCGDEIYDILFCFRLRSFRVWELMRNVANITVQRIYVDFDDIESLATWREIPYLRPVIGRIKTGFAWLELAELWLTERKVQKRADGISICSNADQERLRKRGGKARVHVVPNAYPPTTQLPLRPLGNPARILFLGTMAYPPNDDAINFFHAEVLPLILKDYEGDIRVDVVGHRPGPRVLELAKNPIVTVTGGVPSVLPYYEEADIVIAPIRFGGGTRIKILEALSYGRPMVSSTIGAEGLGLRHEHDLLLADNAEDFAAACVRLLKDAELRARLVANGRQAVLENFSLVRVQENFRRIFTPHIPHVENL